MSYFAMDYYNQIAQGRYSNITPWEKLGFNDTIVNVEEDIIPQGGLYTWPAAATKMDLVSSNANDDGDPVGTGARTVTIYGLGATYNSLSETVTLNGTTPVQTANTYLRINNMRVATVGALNKPAGNLTLSETGGTTYRYGYIRAGFTRQRTMIYTVPLGQTLYIVSGTFSSTSGSATHWLRWTLRATYDDRAGLVLPANFFMPISEFQIQDATFQRDYQIPMRLPATVDIKLSGIADAVGSNEVCSCALRGYLVS